MNDLIFGDKIGNYIMISAFGFDGLKGLGIEESVIERLKTKPFANLKNEVFEICDITTLEDMELLTDLYVGTIFNNAFTENEVIEYVFEIELPESFIPFSLQFNKYEPILKWKEHYFNATITKYNQFLISYIGKINPYYDTKCFNITSKQ